MVTGDGYLCYRGVLPRCVLRIVPGHGPDKPLVFEARSLLAGSPWNKRCPFWRIRVLPEAGPEADVPEARRGRPGRADRQAPGL